LQIIRTGNGITLLTNEISTTEEPFWKTNHFEDIAKFVFWTFNKIFLLKIIDGIQLVFSQREFDDRKIQYNYWKIVMEDFYRRQLFLSVGLSVQSIIEDICPYALCKSQNLPTQCF